MTPGSFFQWPFSSTFSDTSRFYHPPLHKKDALDFPKALFNFFPDVLMRMWSATRNRCNKGHRPHTSCGNTSLSSLRNIGLGLSPALSRISCSNFPVRRIPCGTSDISFSQYSPPLFTFLKCAFISRPFLTAWPSDRGLEPVRISIPRTA